MVFRVASSVTTTGGGAFPGYYGSFFSSLDQTDGTTPHLMYAENTADAAGVSMATGVESTKSQMTFANAGTYNIQFSAQLHNKGGGGSGQTVNIWFKLNGNNIANSDTKIVVPSNAPYVVAAWNFIVSVAAGDYVEIAWFTDNVNIILEHEASTAQTPAIPSVIMTAVQIR
jgi:hypothetical protein